MTGRTHRVIVGAVAVLLASAASAVSAAVIVDQSPDVLANPEFFRASDYNHNQNFLMRLVLTAATTLTGFDNYSSIPIGVGEGVVIKIRDDVAGLPAAINRFRYETILSHVDSIGATSTTPLSRRHADFTPTTLAAGTYWIGMSGAGELAWSTYDVGYYAPEGQWQLVGEDLQRVPEIGHFAYRIFSGAAGAVPEPATWALMVGGFGFVGAAARRRRNGVAA